MHQESKCSLLGVFGAGSLTKLHEGVRGGCSHLKAQIGKDLLPSSFIRRLAALRSRPNLSLVRPAVGRSQVLSHCCLEIGFSTCRLVHEVLCNMKACFLESKSLDWGGGEKGREEKNREGGSGRGSLRWKLQSFCYPLQKCHPITTVAFYSLEASY